MYDIEIMGKHALTRIRQDRKCQSVQKGGKNTHCKNNLNSESWEK